MEKQNQENNDIFAGTVKEHRLKAIPIKHTIFQINKIQEKTFLTLGGNTVF